MGEYNAFYHFGHWVGYGIMYMGLLANRERLLRSSPLDLFGLCGGNRKVYSSEHSDIWRPYEILLHLSQALDMWEEETSMKQAPIAV